MRIEKKTWPDLFEKVMNGEKKFDLRLADFEVNVGDTLILREWDPISETYTGRELERKVSFVMNTKDVEFWSEKDIEEKGLVVMSLV